MGPIWRGGGHGEAKLLRDSYINSLELAVKHKCKSIAFPLISSGIYGYPKDQALHIAISSIGEFLMKNDIDVYLVVFDRSSYKLSEKLFSAIESISTTTMSMRLDTERFRRLSHYEVQRIREFSDYRAASGRDQDETRRPIRMKPVRQIRFLRTGRPGEECRLYKAEAPMFAPVQKETQQEDVIGELDETFSEMLRRLIIEKSMTDVETYKRANIDRRLFSKIRSNKDYKPSKPTAMALAIALKLSLDGTLELLARAGYTLSLSSKFDVIIRYFIERATIIFLKSTRRSSHLSRIFWERELICLQCELTSVYHTLF